MTALTPDACWAFVSLTGGGKPGLAVLKHNGGRIELVRTVAVKEGLTGLVVTHDGKLLVATDGRGVILMDVQRLTADHDEDPVAGVIHDAPRANHPVMPDGRKPPDWLVAKLSAPGTVAVNITRDDKLLFVSNENAQSITVIDIGQVRASGDATGAIVGRIPVGNGPVALRFSADERWLYSTSQSALLSWKWSAVCDAENPNRRAGKYAEGAVVVIDVARSATDPEHAVVARVPAGCNPVRLTLGPGGDRLYVSARGTHEVLAFKTDALINDSAHALLGKTAVGRSPVPVAVLPGGKTLLVGNSNRFGGAGSGSVSVVNVAKLEAGEPAVTGTIPCGGFPRDLTLTPDGRTLFLTSFASQSLQMMDVERLPGN